MSLFNGIAISLLVGLVASQTTTTLPAPPSYADGKFTNPDTGKAQVFTNGSEMNITWTTTYDSVTLWLIYDGMYNNPTLEISGTTQKWFLWTVNDNGNNTRPFSFRAVNTGGTQAQQRQGGFYTGQFWIADSRNPGRSTTITTTTSATSLAGSSTTPISASALGNAASETSSPSTSSTPTLSSSSSSSNGTAIGVGVGVGVGVALLLIAGFAFWYMRRKKSKNAAPPPQSDLPMSYAGGYAPSEVTRVASPDPNSYYGPTKSPQPSEMEGGYHHQHQAVEAPNLQEPRELPADTSGAQLAGGPQQGKNKPPAEYR